MVSPASRLRDVVVRNEQTGAVWRARRAEIVEGRIHVHGTLPDDLLTGPSQTCTVTGIDGGERTRRYQGVKLQSREDEVAVFV